MPGQETNRNVAAYIGGYCSKWNISLNKFADKCGIPYMTIKRIMAEEVQKIDVSTVLRIAEATHSPLMEVLGVNTQNLELYRRIANISDYDRDVLLFLLTMLEKIRVSGRENRQIPCTCLLSDRKGYFLDENSFCSDCLDYSRMQKLSFRSSFEEGISYFGFRLPDNRLSPRFFQNDILLISGMEPSDGDLGVFAWKEEGCVRIIFRIIRNEGRFTRLLPINGRGKTYTIDNEDVSSLLCWVRLGVVTGMIR